VTDGLASISLARCQDMASQISYLIAPGLNFLITYLGLLSLERAVTSGYRDPIKIYIHTQTICLVETPSSPITVNTVALGDNVLKV